MIYIKYLSIKEFYTLKNFELEFDDFKPISVFIGKNGSGKSTILEALTHIFAAIHKDIDINDRTLILGVPFEFELLYYVAKTTIIDVQSTSLSDKTLYTEIHVRKHLDSTEGYQNSISINDGEEKSFFEYENPKSFIPNLVIYYSGFSENIKNLYDNFVEEYRGNLRKKSKSSLEAYTKIKTPPIFYAEAIHYQMLLATLLSYQYNDNVDSFLSKKFGYNKIDSTEVGVELYIFINKKQFVKGKDFMDFWGADGEIGIFLQRIREKSLSEFFPDGKTDDEDGLVYGFTVEGWYKLREEYIDEKTLFTMLNMLYSEGLLAEIKPILDFGDSSVSHERISEGERQLITIKALCEIFLDDNTIFLMDEPDTFLHPSWQEDFIEDIYDYSNISLDKPYNRSNFLITTHSPIILSNLRDGNVFKVQNGNITNIKGHYYGREYSYILEDLMQTNRRNNEITEKLKKLFEMVDNGKTKEAQLIIAELKNEIGEDPELTKAQTLIDFF